MRTLDDMERQHGRTVEATRPDVPFMVDGTDYLIDLSDTNYRRLMEALTPFVKAARPRGRRGATSVHRSTTTYRQQTREVRDQNLAIRDWARAQGYKVTHRGRIPVEVLAAYRDRDVEGSTATYSQPSKTEDEPVSRSEVNGYATVAETIEQTEQTAPVDDPAAEPTPEPAPPRRRRREKPSKRPRFASKKDLNHAVRTWCAEKGSPIAPTGRIPSHVMQVWVFENGEPILEDAK